MSLELLLPLTLIDLTPSPPSSSRRRRRNELRSHCRYRTALFHHRAATVSALKTPSPGSPPTSVAQLCSIVAGAISVPPVSPSVVPLSPSCSRSALLCSRLLASSSRHCHREKLNLSALHRSAARAALCTAASSASHHQLWAALLLLFFPFPFPSLSLLHSRLRCYNVIVNCLIGIDSGPR
ncbi:hypothetical protein Ahy_A02g005849 isoform C [Arachis hypogaea]|uniref:Uncharacterized protein n=1 Tax=Arachis hypogaea TaxID=3818 RepID=A0A445E8F2_ARAHY|nr:hypothetical protein Ahy_A02g005849 isoform C [Arachis hypogaea]